MVGGVVRAGSSGGRPDGGDRGGGFPAALLAALLAAPLAGCDRLFPGDGTPTAPCPQVALLGEGADLTRHRPGRGQDLTALLVDARLTRIDATCDYARRGEAIEVTLTAGMEAERGPTAEGNVVDLPWFVAVTAGADQRVLDRQAYEERLRFPANVDRVGTRTQPVRLVLPLGGGRRIDDYTVRVSFQLTPEELALNRRRGTR